MQRRRGSRICRASFKTVSQQGHLVAGQHALLWPQFAVRRSLAGGSAATVEPVAVMHKDAALDAVCHASMIDETHMLLAGRDPSDGTLPRLNLFMQLLQGCPDQLCSVARFADLQCNTGGLILRCAQAAIDGKLVREPSA